MKYEEYVQSNRPLWVSGIALVATSLLPLSILVFEGWHSGVPWAAFFAVQIAVLMPGIYLIRPLVFWIWLAVSITISLTGIFTIEHYWNSVPDWMDAEMPKWVSYSIKASIWIIQTSSIVLGIFGWIKYFVGKTHNKALQATSQWYRT